LTAARRAVLSAISGAAVRDAAAAEAAVRAAVEAGHRLRAGQEQDARTVIAWKVSDERAPPGTMRSGGLAGRPSSVAEQAVPRLPVRFQTAIARALLPEERIIVFVRRPARRVLRAFGLRRRSLHEGILVVTDRQVLFMQDSLPPSSTLGHWGYIARVSAIERLAAVTVARAEGLVTLSLTLAAARGDGASVQRTMLRFDYPAAPTFSGAFTVIRHLMGRAPENGVEE
jgi:hypothetical protein